MDPQIIDALTDIRDRMAENHLDVCQRISRLEVAYSDIPQRVSKLEGWRNKFAGGLIVGNMLWVGLIALFKRH